MCVYKYTRGRRGLQEAGVIVCVARRKDGVVLSVIAYSFWRYNQLCVLMSEYVLCVRRVATLSFFASADPAAELIVKAQIHAGGRGKGYFKGGLKGGVQICNTYVARRRACMISLDVTEPFAFGCFCWFLAVLCVQRGGSEEVCF